MKLKTTLFAFLLGGPIAALLTTPATHAATWTGGATTANWGFLANWVSSDEASGADEAAVFGNSFTNGYSIALNAARTVGSITLNNTAANNLVIAIHTSNSVLTLNVTTGSPPINVTNAARTLTINTPVARRHDQKRSRQAHPHQCQQHLHRCHRDHRGSP